MHALGEFEVSVTDVPPPERLDGGLRPLGANMNYSLKGSYCIARESASLVVLGVGGTLVAPIHACIYTNQYACLCGLRGGWNLTQGI